MNKLKIVHCGHTDRQV